MPKRKDIKKILVVGAGPIIIGQACEFDYSGTQACKALKDEGYKVVLINSNPATIMTDPEILFLDEPTSNLDYKTEEHYLKTIKNLNITNVIIAHRIKALNICNKIILMKDGKIIDEGNLDYFKNKYSNFESNID